MEKYHSAKMKINWGGFVIAALLAACTGMLGMHAAQVKFFQGDDKTPDRVALLEEQLREIRCELYEPSPLAAARVTLTCYNSEERQTDSTPWITAINTKCRPGIVAVSRDLLEAGWCFGSRVWIEGMGVYVVEDVMNARIEKGIDVWQDQDRAIFKANNVLAVLVRESPPMRGRGLKLPLRMQHNL